MKTHFSDDSNLKTWKKGGISLGLWVYPWEVVLRVISSCNYWDILISPPLVSGGHLEIYLSRVDFAHCAAFPGLMFKIPGRDFKWEGR